MPTENEPGATKDTEQGGRLDQKRGLDDLREGRPGEEDPLDIIDFLEKDFRFEPRKAEKMVLDRIEAKVQELAGPVLEESDRVLERFYDVVKVEVDPDTGEILDQPVEDWSQLTGQDTEAAIWGLQRVITELGRDVAKMYMNAQFAYNVWDDAYWENYQKPIEGTINDRIAYARRHTKQERYYYFYMYYMWRIVNSRFKQLVNTKKDIEFSAQRAMKREEKQARKDNVVY